MFLAAEPASTGTTVPGGDALLDGAAQLVVAELLALQILRHQVVVALDGGLDQLLAIARPASAMLAGMSPAVTLLSAKVYALPETRSTTPERAGLLADGDRQRDDLVPKCVAQRFERATRSSCSRGRAC